MPYLMLLPPFHLLWCSLLAELTGYQRAVESVEATPQGIAHAGKGWSMEMERYVEDFQCKEWVI